MRKGLKAASSEERELKRVGWENSKERGGGDGDGKESAVIERIK
jgi:hypothetical protein